MSPSLVAVIIFAVLVIVVLVKTAVIVPQKNEYIIERLGKYSRTLGAGFHILLPFIDRVAYRFMLKEEVVNIASQTCITKDNVTVEVDGLIYLQVQDSKLAAYGINDYRLAAAQLAQTTLRSCIGRIDLDKTFEERENINAQVVQAIDEAAQSWGLYEYTPKMLPIY
nr:paraslipin [uncultured Desulfuromonas sp.]